eukprot:Skav233997  [mRNA]  locus=scaffold2413:217020:217994:+ [translate_table: standard]
MLDGDFTEAAAPTTQVQEVPATCATTNDLPKKDTPTARLKKYLAEKKAARDDKQQEPTKPVVTEPRPETTAVPIATTSVAPAQDLLPQKPAEWVEHQTPVTADQQQPPKPRGRKKANKGEADECQEMANKATPKAKAKAKGEPKAKAKTTSKTGVDHKNQPKAKAKAKGAKASASGKNNKSAHPEEYEPLKVEEPIGMDKGAAFDQYAVTCANEDVHKLEQAKATPLPAEPTTKKRKRPESSASTASTKVARPKVDPSAASTRTARKRPAAEASEKTRKPANNQEAEKKARLSRKSVAYKREYNKQIKNGAYEETARAAAKQVS